MTEYEIALFLHIVGTVGMFAGIGTSIGVLHFARRAVDVASVRALMGLGAPAGRAIPLFSVVVLATGAYMVEDVWDWERPWIYISLVGFFILFAMGPLVNAQRMKAIGMEAGQSQEQSISPDLRDKLEDPVLATSERTMTMATVGIIYLMTAKPELGDSLIAMGVAVIVGLLLSVPEWRRRPVSPAAPPAP